MSTRGQSLRIAYAREHAKKNPDAERIEQLRAEMAEARMAEWIETQLAKAPPLSEEQRSRLAALFAGGTVAA